MAGVTGAPVQDGPLDGVGRGLDAAAAMLGQFRRDLSRQRQAVIATNPELREREVGKPADYAEAVAAALYQRDVSEPQATLAVLVVLSGSGVEGQQAQLLREQHAVEVDQLTGQLSVAHVEAGEEWGVEAHPR